MDLPVVLAVLLFFTNLLIGVLGWMLKGQIGQIKENRDSFNNFRVEVAQHYATKNDVNDGITRIERKLDQLFDDIHRSNQK